MINLRMIFRILGLLAFMEVVMMLCCVGVSLFYGEDDLSAFLITIGITMVAGGVCLWLGRHPERTFGKREGVLIVGVSWIFFSIFGMLPFMISGYVPDVTNAFFETMSGFTSTGATVLDNIESLPHGLLFWRSMTQWIGGLGIVFFTLAVLPIFGIGGVQLFAAEASNFSDKVHPRIGVTAKWIWSIYSGLTLIICVLLWVGGMSWFDAVCHAFSTTGTGGYSTKQASIAYYNSPYIEYVISAGMLVSGINFTLLLLFINGKFQKFFQDSELKWYLNSVIFFVTIITIGLYKTTDLGFEMSFRRSLFQVVSLHTSTGFTTCDYMQWQPIFWGLLTILMLIGASSGSTTGGLKCIRLVLLSKITSNEFKRIIHPSAVLPIRINKRVVSSGIVPGVLAFMFVYVVVVVSSCLLMASFGVKFEECIGTVISSLGNMGPGLGTTGPAYTWNALPDAAKWLSSFLMLIGRLELFTILILFTPGFWKK